MLTLNHLSGFGVPAAPAGLTTLSQVLSATGMASTITVPGGVQAGDLLVFWEDAVPPPAAAVPSGFTQITTVLVGSLRSVLSYKIAAGTEGGTSISGLGGAAAWDKALLVFRGNKPIASVAVGSVGQEGTANDPTPQVVAASGGAAPLVVIGGYSNGSAIAPRTFTVSGVDAKDGEINPNTLCYLAWKIYNSAPANVTVDSDDEGTNNIVASCYLACT